MPYPGIFNIAYMSFYTIRGKKILAKIFEFTVFNPIPAYPAVW